MKEMMNEQWAKIKEWWSPLAPREKQAVMLGGLLLGIFIVYQWIWTPLLDHVALLRNRIQTEQATLVFMQAADKDIQKIENQSQNKKRTSSPVELLSFLQKQIDQAGLSLQLTQLKQATHDSIEMHFQKVEFDKLMRLLVTMVKGQNISIVQMSAVSENSPGMVSVDMVLKIG